MDVGMGDESHSVFGDVEAPNTLLMEFGAPVGGGGFGSDEADVGWRVGGVGCESIQFAYFHGEVVGVGVVFGQAIDHFG